MHTTTALVLLIIAELIPFRISSQSIHFNYQDGTNLSYSLEDVRKINFESELMNLHLFDGSVYSWNISTISYYEYDETLVNIVELIKQANNFQVVVFPNPVNSTLQVQYNLPETDAILISLFDMQGKLIIEKSIIKQDKGHHHTILDISHLVSGTYLCRIKGKKETISKTIVKQ